MHLSRKVKKGNAHVVGGLPPLSFHILHIGMIAKFVGPSSWPGRPLATLEYAREFLNTKGSWIRHL